MDPALFRADVEAAPARLAALAEHLDRADPWSHVDLRGVQRVLLLGIGSSLYGAEVVARRLRARGLVALAETAAVEASWPPDAGTLVVAVSAGGSSAETLDAASRYERTGRLVALTENPGSQLAGLVGATVELGAGPERGGVACRTYRHTLVLLLALADRLAGSVGGRGELAGVVMRASEATGDLLDRRPQWLPRVAAAMDCEDGVHVLAPARRMASAQQSALMVREGPRRPASASETAEWAHVDVYLAKTLDYRALLLPGSRWDDQAMRWLVLRGSTVVPVGAPVEGAGEPVRYLHDDEDDVRLLAEVTVAELVAASWWEADQPAG